MTDFGIFEKKIEHDRELEKLLTSWSKNIEWRVVNGPTDAGGRKTGKDSAVVRQADTGQEHARHSLADGAFVVDANSTVVSGGVMVWLHYVAFLLIHAHNTPLVKMTGAFVQVVEQLKYKIPTPKYLIPF